MKRITTACLISLLAISSFAYGKGSPWYMGIKGGFMDAGTGITDNAINAGLDIGYQHNRYLSTEAELTRTFIEGETNSGNDWEVDTLSVFAALRSNTKVKLKGKIGLSNIDTGRNDDTELSLGIGIGFWALGGLAEIEYTQLSDDEDLDFFSFGVNYFF